MEKHSRKRKSIPIRGIASVTLGLALSIGATAYATASGLGFKVLGTKLTHDETNDQVVISQASVSLDGRGQLTAETLRFQLPERGTVPYITFLPQGGTITIGKHQFFLGEGTRYYPELSTAVSKRVRDITRQTEYTCKNSKLHKDGIPTGSKEVCIDGIKLTCSGDYLVTIATDQCIISEY